MKLIAFLAFITSMAWADTNCREQIDCTGIQFYICRKACPEGGFTFTTGGECSSDYEPVLGYCDVKNKKAKFIPNDMAYATMAEGARRAGDQYYRSNPTVVWRCGSSSNGSIPPNFPKTQVLKLKYQRKSYLTVGELDATAINEFLDQLESNFPNYNVTDCLNKLSNELENVVKLACEATDKELNVSKNLFCEQSVIPKLVWKHQARIAKLSRKVKDSQLPYVHVLGLVNGGSNREIEQSVEASINNCSIFSVNDSFVYIEYIRDLKPRVQNLDPTCRKNLLKSIVRFLPSQLRGFCEKEKQHPQCLEIRSANARLLPELANTFPTEFKQARIHADHLAKIICRKDVNIVGTELLKLMNRVKKLFNVFSFNLVNPKLSLAQIIHIPIIA